MTYLDSTYTSDTDLRAAVIATLVSAGWQTTTYANPYTSTIDYYVLKSSGTSNAAGVDYFVCVWADTTNHRVALMPFVQFTDAVTPLYAKFIPSVSAMPGGDGYHTQALQAIGSFTGGPGCIVIQRGTGTGRLVMQASLNMVWVSSKDSSANYRGGCFGLPDYGSWCTGRPELFLWSNPEVEAYGAGGTYMATAAQSIPTGNVRSAGCAVDLGGPYVSSHYWSCAIFPFQAGLNAEVGMMDSTAIRDYYDPTKSLAWQVLVGQFPNFTMVTPRHRVFGAIRNCYTLSGMQPEIGDAIVIGADTYHAVGVTATASSRALYAKSE